MIRSSVVGMVLWVVLVWVVLIACGSSDSGASTHVTLEPASSGSDGAHVRAAGSTEPTLVVGTDACASDADCVPGACCHATTCVARANTPACGESVCTSDCRYGTLDCGGGCLCHQGHCAARLSALPVIPGVTDVQ